jgi:5'-nucleotidase
MKILLSNDDGVRAPGLRVLCEHLRSAYHVVVVAPDRNQSGSSQSLSIRQPRYVEKWSDDYVVDGSPADCVRLGLSGLLTECPDCVISGINAGENIADDVWYSGTVGAAREGIGLPYAPIAVSLAGHTPQHYQTAAQIVMQLLPMLLAKHAWHALSTHDVLWNINVPDVPYANLRGVRFTHLAKRLDRLPILKTTDIRQKITYWIAPPAECEENPDSDAYALKHGYVSITPLTANQNHPDYQARCHAWQNAMVNWSIV